METAYAQALLKIVQSGTSHEKAVADLKKMLASRGRSALLPKIARAFKRLAAREANRDTMTLTVARKKDFATALKAAQSVLAEQGMKEMDLCESVDDTLIGGWRLEGRGLLIDRSWKNSLLSIYNRVTQ